MNYEVTRQQIEKMDERLRYAHGPYGVLDTAKRRILVTDTTSVLEYIKERNRQALSIGLPELGPRNYMDVSEPTRAETPAITDANAEISHMDREIIDMCNSISEGN